MSQLLENLNDKTLNNFFPGKKSGTVKMLRLDLLHPVVSGNKVFKLERHLHKARQQNKTIVSFGGPWSNHLHALAWCAKESGLKSVGLVRGEQQQTGMLEDVQQWGMQIEFVSRSEYRQRHNTGYLQQLKQRFPDAVIVPEGGGGLDGVLPCQKIVSVLESLHEGVFRGLPEDRLGQQQNNPLRSLAEVALQQDSAPTLWHSIALASGTGATAAGVASALPDDKFLHVVPALKSEKWLQPELKQLLQQLNQEEKLKQLQIHHGFYRKGFAIADSQLIDFIQKFEADSGICLEPVYTGKLLMALSQLWQQVLDGHKIAGLSQDQTLVIVHTGGLQGRRGFGLSYGGRGR